MVFGQHHPSHCHVRSQCGEVKLIVNGLKVISAVSRRIYTTCFFPLKSGCRVKTAVQPVAALALFKQCKMGERGSLKKNKSYKAFLLG